MKAIRVLNKMLGRNRRRPGSVASLASKKKKDDILEKIRKTNRVISGKIGQLEERLSQQEGIFAASNPQIKETLDQIRRTNSAISGRIDELEERLSEKGETVEEPDEEVNEVLEKIRKTNRAISGKIGDLEGRLSQREEAIEGSGQKIDAVVDECIRISGDLHILSGSVSELKNRVSSAVDKAEKASRQFSEGNLLATSPVFTPVRSQAASGQKTRVLLADDFHINERNFKSLYEKLKHSTISSAVAVPKGHDYFPLIQACGDYSNFSEILSSRVEQLAELASDDLFNLVYKNVPVAQIAKDEALSLLIRKPSWQSEKVEKDSLNILNKIWQEDREILLLNCAACMLWADFWSDYPDINKFDAAIVFSGSYIYGRTLLHLLQYTKVRSFVIESFATGFDYFMEERHSPLPNNSRIRYAPYRSRYRHMQSDPDSWERDKIRSFNKLRGMQNKNVSQPTPKPLPRAIEPKKVMLILGQVVNDFSLISGCGTVLCSIPEYKELISELLSDPNTFIIFKAHPWEKKKQNIGSSLTEDAISRWAESLTADKRGRLLVVSDWNLLQMVRISDFVFTLCSQSAIEAALEGLKPVVIGGSFFDSAGFTSNFSSASLAARSVLSGDIRGTLSLGEYSAFEEYLTVLIQCHLINTDASGVGKITGLLRKYKAQGHTKSYISERTVMPSWDDGEV